jgi:hypothetical protein
MVRYPVSTILVPTHTHTHTQASIWSVIMLSTILVSSISFIVASLPEYYRESNAAFDILEMVVSVVCVLYVCVCVCVCV